MNFALQLNNFRSFRSPKDLGYENKDNHPMYGKTHTKESLLLISKPGELTKKNYEL